MKTPSPLVVLERLGGLTQVAFEPGHDIEGLR